MVIDQHTAEHYTWGQQCEGWYMLKHEDLNVIIEVMLPGTSEVLHHHKKAQQFFYILGGEAVIEADGAEYVVRQRQGFHIVPGLKHRIFNRTPYKIEFMLISQPRAQTDRYND